MTGFALKVKTKTGQQVIRNLTPQSTIQDLKIQLSTLSNIPVDRLHVLYSFPPKTFDLAIDGRNLHECGLSSGDLLILEEKKITETAQVPIEIEIEARDCPGILMKQVVPADNSCLFTSIHFVLNGELDKSGGVAAWMRQIIAETIAGDPDNYSEAILGKPNPDYCNWIRDDKSWGGAIELAILSNYYGMEIAVVDTINAIINRFGEDQRYAHRVLLLFDGIHYDPLFLEPIDGGKIRTIFPRDDERILNDAEQLAKEAKASRQFTDVNKFTLKCIICDVLLSGQTEAQQHAQETGHTNFGEV